MIERLPEDTQTLYASLWDIGGERVWGLHDATTNSLDLADAVDAARWTRWERIRVAGVDHLLLEDAGGQFRLFGDATVHASAAEARGHIARTVAEQKRKQEEEAAAHRRGRRARAAERSGPARVGALDAELRPSDGDRPDDRPHRDGRREVHRRSGVLSPPRARPRPRAARRRPLAHQSATLCADAVRTPLGVDQLQQFLRRHRLPARDSTQFRAWVQQRELWNQRFDQRWGFDRRR